MLGRVGGKRGEGTGDTGERGEELVTRSPNVRASLLNTK